jgi:oxygen-independent coproporphyrinogen-3 oxidase
MALAAVTAALAEVPRVSADLMFGMPEQSAADFLNELQQITDLGLRHLSVYALTIEPDTQFGALHRKGRLQLAPEGDFADTFIATDETLAVLGLGHYEVSNYAAPGQESVHNLHYWQAGSYLGVGAGAVGCLRQHGQGGRRYRNHPNPKTYLEASSDGQREISTEALTAEDTLHEGLMLGLRTAGGVDIEHLSALAGQPVRTGRQQAIARQCELGNLVDTGTRLQVPRTRWLHLDSIVADLF